MQDGETDKKSKQVNVIKRVMAITNGNNSQLTQKTIQQAKGENNGLVSYYMSDTDRVFKSLSTVYYPTLTQATESMCSVGKSNYFY